MIRLGFHLSVAGQLSNAPITAKQHKYGAFQIFTSNPRSWSPKPIDKGSAEDFKLALKASGATPFAHMPYLCNLASPKNDVYKKSIEILKKNIHNCQMLDIKYLVLHIGSHLGSGTTQGMSNISNALNKITYKLDVTLLLENSAGYNNSIGSKFEQIGKIIDSADSKKIGLCLDTCHAFAAGYDIRSEEGVLSMVKEIDTFIGFDKLSLVHLNDAKFELGSGRDRHYHIGKGNIGKEGFIEFFKNKHFRNGCFVMETPYFEGSEEQNMNEAKLIIKQAASYSNTPKAKTK